MLDEKTLKEMEEELLRKEKELSAKEDELSKLDVEKIVAERLAREKAKHEKELREKEQELLTLKNSSIENSNDKDNLVNAIAEIKQKLEESEKKAFEEEQRALSEKTKLAFENRMLEAGVSTTLIETLKNTVSIESMETFDISTLPKNKTVIGKLPDNNTGNSDGGSFLSSIRRK